MTFLAFRAQINANKKIQEQINKEDNQKKFMFYLEQLNEIKKTYFSIDELEVKITFNEDKQKNYKKKFTTIKIKEFVVAYESLLKIYQLIMKLKWQEEFEIFSLNHDMRFSKPMKFMIHFSNEYSTFIKEELKKLNPNIVFSYTHKAVVVGSICAFLAGRLRSFSLITGTGHIFDNSTIVERVKRFVGILGFKLALRVNEKIFFQNPDDLRLFCNLKMVSENKTFLVNGSGVDLDKFSVRNIPEQPVFLCMSRLIKSKGLIEYLKEFFQ